MSNKFGGFYIIRTMNLVKGVNKNLEWCKISPCPHVIRYEEIRDFLKKGGHGCRYNGSPLKLVLKIAWSTCSETVSNTQCGCAVTVTPLHRYTVTWLHGYTVTLLHRYTVTPLHGYTVTPLHHYTHLQLHGTRLHCYYMGSASPRCTDTPLNRYLNNH